MVGNSWLELLLWVAVILLAAFVHKIGHLFLASPEIKFSLFQQTIRRQRTWASSLMGVGEFLVHPYAGRNKQVSRNTKLRFFLVGSISNIIFFLAIMTLLAFFGTPSVTDKQYDVQNAEVVYDELRLTSIPEVKGANELLVEGVEIDKISTESIRDSDHLEELLVHFADRDVLIEFYNSELYGRQFLTITDDVAQELVSSQATLTKYGSSAPVVGLLTSYELLSSTVSQSLDWAFGFNIDDNSETIAQRIQAYKLVSFERIGFMAAIATMLMPLIYLLAVSVLLVTAVIKKSAAGRIVIKTCKNLLRRIQKQLNRLLYWFRGKLRTRNKK